MRIGLRAAWALRAYDRTMRHKLGLLEVEDDGDEALVRDLFQVRFPHETTLKRCKLQDCIISRCSPSDAEPTQLGFSE